MRQLLITFVAVLVLATACGSSGDDPDAALPFDAVLLELFGTDDVSEYRYQIERDAEARLVSCMADAGFEFIIGPPTPRATTDDLFVERSFAEEEGFGIINRFREWIATSDLEAIGVDVNRQYVNTLTSDQMQSYFLTLEGEVADPGQISENPGCRGQAANEAYSVWNAFLQELPTFTALGEERDTHPEWLSARADWRTCMVDKGYDYPEPEMIRADVQNRMDQDVAIEFADGGLPVVYEDGGWVIQPEAEAKLLELQAFEIDAATANWECNEPLLERFRAVEREVQQAFVDRNQDTIDDLLAGYGTR